MNKKYAFGLLILFALIATTCDSREDESTEIDLEFDYTHYEIRPSLKSIVDDMPNLASSTSAQPIWIEVMCWAFDVPCGWSYYSLAPERAFEHRAEFESFIWEQIVATGTHDAYEALVEDDADIIIVARAPSEDEITAAQNQGIELDIRSVALDAFVFVVNSQNTIDDLSISQLQDIYSGKITNWKDVGGPDQEIHAYQRNENSGSQELMESMVMNGMPMIDAEDMISPTMGGIISALDYDPLGLGYSVHFYVKKLIPNDRIEFIGVNGTEPTPETIYNGQYPLTSEVYVVIRDGEPPDSSATLLRNWLLSDEGQLIIRRSGYVPIQ